MYIRSTGSRQPAEGWNGHPRCRLVRSSPFQEGHEVKVFVVGGTGEVGRRVVVQLITAGHQVSALARSAQKFEMLQRAGARAVPVSLFDQDALGDALAGQDAVVSLATHVPIGSSTVQTRSWREDDRVRAEGSRILVDAALHQQVGRLVQEAVTFIYPDRGEDWITEQTIPAPNPRSQTATMAATEQAVRFTAAGACAAVLRFGQFYGPDRASIEVLARVRAGKPVVLGTPDGWLSPVHPEDAAAAVLLALRCPPGIYNVCEPPVRRSEWATAIGTAVGAGPAKFYPTLVQRLAGPRAEPLSRSHRVESTAFASATGWAPRSRSTHGGWSGYPTTSDE
jgi:nucleoside-diphosphate-sugar epimerase